MEVGGICRKNEFYHLPELSKVLIGKYVFIFHYLKKQDISSRVSVTDRPVCGRHKQLREWCEERGYWIPNLYDSDLGVSSSERQKAGGLTAS